MKNSQNISKITVIVVFFIVILIIGLLCVMTGIFPINFNEESITYDYSEQINKEVEIREIIANIEGDENVTILDNGKRVNNSISNSNTYNVGNFVFENFEISCIDNITKVTCNITNNGSQREDLGNFYIQFNDENGVCKASKIVEGKMISSGKTETFDIIINADVSNTYSISLRKIDNK